MMPYLEDLDKPGSPKLVSDSLNLQHWRLDIRESSGLLENRHAR